MLKMDQMGAAATLNPEKVTCVDAMEMKAAPAPAAAANLICATLLHL